MQSLVGRLMFCNWIACNSELLNTNEEKQNFKLLYTYPSLFADSHHSLSLSIKPESVLQAINKLQCMILTYAFEEL